MNNRYVKQFIIRGMWFGGFGPVIVGIVYLVLTNTLEEFSLTGSEVFLAIISTYILAFIQAGASIFNQIEGWGVAKSLFFHLTSIYIAYIACYLVNSWIPFNWVFIGIFTGIFVITYFVIWLVVMIVTRKQAKKMTDQLNIKTVS